MTAMKGLAALLMQRPPKKKKRERGRDENGLPLWWLFRQPHQEEEEIENEAPALQNVKWWLLEPHDWTEPEPGYSSVTNRIIADLEKGVRPWQKPWDAEHPAGSITRPLRHNGVPYRGMNVLLLWGESLAQGYNTPIWMTFKQAAALGGHVRRGEHGSLVVFADRFTKTETDDAGHRLSNGKSLS